MKYVIPAVLLLSAIAGCAQVPSAAIPVEDRAQQVETGNPYGVIYIQEPVSEGVESQGDYGIPGSDDAVTAFIPPDQSSPINTAADAAPVIQGDIDPSNLDADGLYSLGRQYIEGDGVEKNESIGEHYIGLSAELGRDEAKRVLGLIRIRRNPADTEALGMLQDAAQSSTKAQMQLGFLYANQAEPHLNDPDKGLALIEKAYRGGSAEAAFYYSRLIASTDPQSSSEALAYSAAQGFGKALLANAKAQGGSMRSADLYLHAARSGDASAMYEYANGLIIQKFKPTLTGFEHPAEVEALAWFSLASDHGNSLAATEVKNLKGVSVDLAKQGTSLEAVKRQVQSATLQFDESPALRGG